MNVLTIITIIGGVILTLGYLPQIYKLYQTNTTAGINLGFWFLIAGAVFITATNLILDSAPLILVVIQLINASLAAVVIYKIQSIRGQLKFGVALMFIVILIAAVTLPMEVTQSAATLMILIAYTSQLITLIKSPSVEGVSPTLYLLIALGLGIMATKMFVTEVTTYIIVTEMVNIILLLLCACVSFYYQHKGDSINE